MSRPELVVPFRKSEPDGKHVRWKLSDTLIMIVAAIRVLLPYVLVILAAVFGASLLVSLLFQ